MAFEWVPILSGSYITYRGYIALISCCCITLILFFLLILLKLAKVCKSIGEKYSKKKIEFNDDLQYSSDDDDDDE